MDGSGANNKWIGQRTIRPDGAEKVIARSVHPSYVEGQIQGAAEDTRGAGSK